MERSIEVGKWKWYKNGYSIFQFRLALSNLNRIFFNFRLSNFKHSNFSFFQLPFSTYIPRIHVQYIFRLEGSISIQVHCNIWCCDDIGGDLHMCRILQFCFHVIYLRWNALKILTVPLTVILAKFRREVNPDMPEQLFINNLCDTNRNLSFYKEYIHERSEILCGLSVTCINLFNGIILLLACCLDCKESLFKYFKTVFFNGYLIGTVHHGNLT